jgi:DNA-binding transcriptional regulator YdaS (Cro superfamily)
MKKSEAVAFYGTQAALAKALGIEPAAVSQWIEIPEVRQYQIEVLTGGVLKADRRAGIEPASDTPSDTAAA